MDKHFHGSGTEKANTVIQKSFAVDFYAKSRFYPASIYLSGDFIDFKQKNWKLKFRTTSTANRRNKHLHSYNSQA